MRARVFQLGSQGDVRPLVMIARGLADRGHEVRVHVNARFAGLVGEAGLSFEPLGTEAEYAALLENPDVWHARKGPKLLNDAIFGESLRRELEVVTRERPDVVVAGTFSVGAQLASEKHAIPFARVHLQPSVFFGPHDPPVLPSGKKPGGPLWLRRALLGLLDTTLFRSGLGKPLNAARSELGLTPWRKNFMGAYLAADLNLCMFPRLFAAPTPDWPDNIHQVGFPFEPPADDLPTDLQDFLDAGDPPLVFTPGPAGFLHGDEFFAACADACGRLGRRAVFVTRGLELGGPVPERVFVCGFAPFQRLFPAASLVVHHGGIGTVAHALAAGVPQLITPFGFDQPDNGHRVRQLGVGGVLPRAKLGGASLAQAITDLDTKTTREACRSVRESAAGDESVAGAVAAIEGLAQAPA